MLQFVVVLRPHLRLRDLFTNPIHPSVLLYENQVSQGRCLLSQDTCFLQNASLLLMHCWTSGKQMAVGITIIQVSDCADTSILTIRGVILWIPLSLVNILVELVI